MEIASFFEEMDFLYLNFDSSTFFPCILKRILLTSSIALYHSEKITCVSFLCYVSWTITVVWS